MLPSKADVRREAPPPARTGVYASDEMVKAPAKWLTGSSHFDNAGILHFYERLCFGAGGGHVCVNILLPARDSSDPETCKSTGRSITS